MCLTQHEVLKCQKKIATNNVTVWFDIPVNNLARAVDFYTEVRSVELKSMAIDHEKQAHFPFVPDEVSGWLKECKEGQPGAPGTMIYLNGGDDLSAPLARAVAAGGTVMKNKTRIAGNSFMTCSKTLKTVMLHIKAGSEWGAQKGFLL